MAEYIERGVVDIPLFAKRDEWRKHWIEYLGRHKGTATYSAAEQAVDNWLRGYGEAIDDYIAISDCLPAADVVEVRWQAIAGYEGLYEVSTLGQVRNAKGCVMKQYLKRDKYTVYKKVSLWKDGKYKQFYVHRLVAEAFIPNPDKLPIVNHKDEDKSNNRVDNLEWCTNHYNLCYGTHNQRVAIANRCHPAVSYGVFSIDGDGNFNFYDSIREASRQTGIPVPNIIRAIKSGTLRAGGRYWRLSYEPPRHASPTTTERGDAEQSAMQQSALAR